MGDRYRVGGHWSGNIYRDNKRWAFTLEDEDGPLVVEAMNGAGEVLVGLRLKLAEHEAAAQRWRDLDVELRKQRDSAWKSYAKVKADDGALRSFLADVLSISAIQILSMSTMDMVTMLAHQRDQARGDAG